MIKQTLLKYVKNLSYNSNNSDWPSIEQTLIPLGNVISVAPQIQWRLDKDK